MTTDPIDPFEALRAPVVPVAPRPAFASALRRRVEEVLRPSTTDEPRITVTDHIATVALTINPYICVHDGVAALGFYAAAFGAHEEMRVTGDDGRIGHAEMTMGSARLMLSDEYPDYGVISPRTLGGTAVTLYLQVADVDRVYADAVAAGADGQRAPSDQTHGNRTATIVDPFGHRWMLSQPIESLTIDEYAVREATSGFTVTGRATPPVER